MTTSRFRTEDPIENMVVKVVLRRQSVAKRPTFSKPDVRDKGGGGAVKESSTENVAVIKWQQKFLGPKEIIKYGKMREGESTLESRYMDEVKEFLKSDEPLPTIFTYVDADPDSETLDRERNSTILADASSHLVPSDIRRRRRTGPSASGSSQIIALRHQPPQTASYQVMVIMAALDTDGAEQQRAESSDQATAAAEESRGRQRHLGDAPTPADGGTSTGRRRRQPRVLPDAFTGSEKVLCFVKAFSNGYVEMTPGFSLDEAGEVEWYRFSSEQGGAWEYTLTNAADFPPEAGAQPAHVRRDADGGRRNLIGTEFTPRPAPLSVTYYVFGEIVSGKNFRVRTPHVEYVLEMPDGWALASNSLTASISQSCEPIWVDTGDECITVTNFCFPFEFEFTSLRREPSGRPTMFFQVSEYDTWDRYTVDSYGFCPIPSVPGCYEVEVPCWLPRPTLRNQMAEFFIGGSMRVAPVNAVAIPSDLTGRVLNKYGIATDQSGRLLVRLNVILLAGSLVQPPERVAVRQPVAVASTQRVSEQPGTRSTQEILARAQQRLARHRAHLLQAESARKAQ